MVSPFLYIVTTCASSISLGKSSLPHILLRSCRISVLASSVRKVKNSVGMSFGPGVLFLFAALRTVSNSSSENRSVLIWEVSWCIIGLERFFILLRNSVMGLSVGVRCKSVGWKILNGACPCRG